MKRFRLTANLLVLACQLAQPAFSQDTDAKTCPPENPPQILVAAEIAPDGDLLLVKYETTFIGFQGEYYNNRVQTIVELTDVKISTVKGDELTVEAARKRIAGNDTPILVSSWKRPLPAFYQQMFAPETLHFVFPKEAPVWKVIEAPGGPVE